MNFNSNGSLSKLNFCLLFGLSLAAVVLAAPVSELNSLKQKGIHHPAVQNTNIKQPEINLNEDEDVFALENLKHATEEVANSELLPELKRKLEAIEASTSIVLDEINMEEQLQRELLKAKQQPEQQQQEHHHHHPMAFEHGTSHAIENQSADKPSAKTFPGAARLTFGQHEADAQHVVTSSNTETTLHPTQSENMEEVQGAGEEAVPPVGASLSSATSNGQRRSYASTFNTKMSKTNNAETLLKHKGGQYSAFDMAQYVFWTGDESGVARAVEEFIQEGLMSRENAIKFLKDIRIGIEYLQNTYSNHFNGGNNGDVDNDRMEMEQLPATTPEPTAPPTSTARTTTTLPATPEQPSMAVGQDVKATLSPNILKIMYKLKIPSLLNLNEAIQNDEGKKPEDNQIDYDEVAGRLRLADFLYAEYSLEEVIYQLAKVMFSQSLVRGSQDAQMALQRLTGFLESEGSHGRISPALQKKILDVLLTALSDTLTENPELLNAAHNLPSVNNVPKTVKTKV